MAIRRKLRKVEDTMARLDIGVKEVDYVSKKVPLIGTCRKGKEKGQFETALGLAIDEKNKQIYICDHKNMRIQLLTLEGEFLKEIGKDELKRPWGIVVTDKHILVTDIWHCYLIQYDKQTHVIINKVGGFGMEEGQLIWPGGLGIDTNGDIYVADTLNHRITVYNEELKFKVCFGKDKLKLPKDIKFTTEEVLVLDHSPNCVHFMSRNGEFLKSIITQGEAEGCMIHGADFFYPDHAGNIIISDRKHDNIKIFSQDGDLMHTIGSHGMLNGEFIKPKGIALTWKGIIFVVSENPTHVLQTF